MLLFCNPCGEEFEEFGVASGLGEEVLYYLQANAGEGGLLVAEGLEGGVEHGGGR